MGREFLFFNKDGLVVNVAHDLSETEHTIRTLTSMLSKDLTANEIEAITFAITRLRRDIYDH